MRYLLAFTIFVLAALASPISPASAAGPVDKGAYGNPWAANNLANLEIGSPKQRQVTYRFRPDADGSVSAVRLFWIFNSSCSSGNYSCGDGGDIEVTLRPDNGSGQPSSTVLARGVDFTPRASFYRTVTFGNSVPVTKTNRYHLVMRNIHSSPASNYVSVDDLQNTDSPRQPLFADADLGVMYKDGSGSWTGVNHTPIFTLTYSDGSKQGPGATYVNARSSSGARSINGQNRVAQTMTPTADVTATGAAFRVRRDTGSGTMTLRLKNSTGSDMRTCTGVVSGTAWLRCTFASPYTLKAGALHRLVASLPSGTNYTAWPLTEGPGFESPWMFTEGAAQATNDNGATWFTPSAADDWQAYLSVTAPTPTPTPTPTPEPTATPTPTPEPTATCGLKAPGTPALADSSAYALVVRNATEQVPANATYNAYEPTQAQMDYWRGIDGQTLWYRNQVAKYSTPLTAFPGFDEALGRQPTTTELIRAAACKWGLDEEWVESVAVQESDWRQGFGGDQRACAAGVDDAAGSTSWGITQIKGTYPNDTNWTCVEGWHGVRPLNKQSTRFNLDYYASRIRACYDGAGPTWITQNIGGDMPGCIGNWFSGGWHDGTDTNGDGVKDTGAEGYYNKVKAIHDSRGWPGA